jgi:SAM-dependent methyltransferase
VKQRDVFLGSEGNAWFERNGPQAVSEFPESDELLLAILQLPHSPDPLRVLEIGCGGGSRLAWLQKHRGFACFGLEPSARAVEAARSQGVSVQQGTAEFLPFDTAAFDLVVFGFCLYLCDREDLFRIASEADRVLRNPGWLAIRDFYNPAPVQQPYHHKPGILSFKMDYRSLFTWHPGYVNHYHKIGHHVTGDYTDDRNEWVATSVMRKELPLRE